jgi:hypothetical protein
MLGSWAVIGQVLLRGPARPRKRTILPPSTLKPDKCQKMAFKVEDILTFSELLNEMLRDGLELGGVNSEHLLQSLDLLHEILWHIGHGACNAMLARIRKDNKAK